MDLISCDKLLTTTRSVRKRLDLSRPVDPEVIKKCLEIAIQAPTGGNLQGWHFVVVTDVAKRQALAELYRRAWKIYSSAGSKGTDNKVVQSAMYLAEHLHEVPVHVVACIEGRVEQQPPVAQASLYGSILPAVWSLMLALRSRGLGAAWTTLHIMFEKEAAALLGIPATFTQAALLPVAWYTGTDFAPAGRTPVEDVTSWNTWGEKQAPTV